MGKILSTHKTTYCFSHHQQCKMQCVKLHFSIYLHISSHFRWTSRNLQKNRWSIVDDKISKWLWCLLLYCFRLRNEMHYASLLLTQLRRESESIRIKSVFFHHLSLLHTLVVTLLFCTFNIWMYALLFGYCFVVFSKLKLKKSNGKWTILRANEFIWNTSSVWAVKFTHHETKYR